MSDIIQLIIGGITMGCVYSLVALGFHIIYNATGAINFAQGEQVILGGVIAVTLSDTFKLPIPVTFVLTMLLAGILGMIYERLAIHPLLGVSEIAVIMGSIAASIIFKHGIFIIWGDEEIFLSPFSAGPPVNLFGAPIIRQSFWIMGLTLASLAFLWIFFKHTIMGKAILACSNNHTGARLVGISPTRVVAYTFGLSGGLGALAGLIVAPITFAGGPMGTVMAVKGFAASILGGLSNATAVVLGGIVLGLLEFFIARFISTGYRDVIALTVLLIALVIRPEGLFVSGSER